MNKLEIRQGSFIQQTQYFIPVEIDLSVVSALLGISDFFHLSRRTTVIQDILVRRQFSLVPENLTNVNVKPVDTNHGKTTRIPNTLETGTLLKHGTDRNENFGNKKKKILRTAIKSFESRVFFWVGRLTANKWHFNLGLEVLFIDSDWLYRGTL